MNQVYISLGTNIEPREKYIDEAIKQLSKHKNITIVEKSPIYETAPVGYVDQADFLNMVVQISTSLLPTDLLDYCQRIEKNLGRERRIRYGPRTIDLDILVYNKENIKTDRLIIPHPRMHERAFVLIPLQEIAPCLVIPGVEKSPRELLKEIDPSHLDGVIRWATEN